VPARLNFDPEKLQSLALVKQKTLSGIADAHKKAKLKINMKKMTES
jgi:hypothetical protein